MDLAHIFFQGSDGCLEFLSAFECLEELGVVVGTKLLNLFFCVVNFWEWSVDFLLDIFSADCVATSAFQHLLQGVDHLTFHYLNKFITSDLI